MTTALEVELKTYAHQLVADHLKEEYDSQIRKKWQPYINKLVDAKAEATKRHRSVLDAVRAQQKAELEALNGLAMLALSFVAGPLLSWVGGVIQYRIYPKYKTSASFKKREVMIASQKSLWPKAVDIFEKDHDKVYAKIFGDMGSHVVGIGIDKGLKATFASSEDAKAKIDAVGVSSAESFKTNLENALLAEADLTIKAIMSLAMSILQNQDYGAECLAKLKRVDPTANRKDIKERDLEMLAKQMIRRDIDRQRKEWAAKWLYYGNDPVWTGQETAALEREIWGLWLLEEQLQYHESEIRDSQDDVLVGMNYSSKGVTFGVPGLPQLVLQRLATLGVVEARTPLQKLQAIAAEEARARLEAARKAREDAEDANIAKAYRDELDAAEGAEDPARERADVNRRRYQEDRNLREKRAQESKLRQPPKVVVIGNKVDSQAEIDALNNWAIYGAPVSAIKIAARTIMPIESVHN